MKRINRSIGLATLVLVVAVSAVAAVTTTASGEVGSSDWRMLSGGDIHTCGIRTSGELYCWGGNPQGQLGDGTTDPRATPTKVAGSFTDWVSVSAGGYRTCALRANRRLYCWGNNSGGSLGVGDQDVRYVPTEVAGGFTNWTSVDLGTAHVCGRRSTGRLYCWGSNPLGALGVGDKSQAVDSHGGVGGTHRLVTRGERGRLPHVRPQVHRAAVLLGSQQRRAGRQRHRGRGPDPEAGHGRVHRLDHGDRRRHSHLCPSVQRPPLLLGGRHVWAAGQRCRRPALDPGGGRRLVHQLDRSLRGGRAHLRPTLYRAALLLGLQHVRSGGRPHL